MVFGLSLLGLFEIRLPSFLLNASAQGEGRGGLIGVVFMALTLTITSFTCTFPVVGGLLVMAAGGNFFYPIVGLATFAAVLALPFFLLALSPGLISQMPRSGDWMNAVKVVGGLVEIGAALEVRQHGRAGLRHAGECLVQRPGRPDELDRPLAGLRALPPGCCSGPITTTTRSRSGPGRLVFGARLPGIGPVPDSRRSSADVPQSQVWNRLIVGLLPPDSSEFSATGPGRRCGRRVRRARSRPRPTDPAQAEREQKSFHGVLWGMSFDQAREQAAAEKKPILIDFTGVNCANCRQMEHGVFPRPEVVALLQQVRDRPALYRLCPDRLDHRRAAEEAGRRSTRTHRSSSPRR